MLLFPSSWSVSPVLTVSSLDKELLMEMGSYCPVCAWGAVISNNQNSISAVAEQPLSKYIFVWEPGGEFHLLLYEPLSASPLKPEQ